jgi:hypothetical protein
MRAALLAAVLTAALSLPPTDLCAQRFHAAADSLERFHGVRYENLYTRVPTSGKLVGVRITDKGATYYICRERGGYVIYHVEIRPIEKLKSKLQAELAKLRREWDRVHPDELLFTKKRFDEEVKRRIRRYSDAVWIRNEVVTGSVGR